MKKGKIIYFGLLVIVFLVSTLFFSYAFFTSKNEEHGKLNIVVGTIDYKLESNDLNENNQITVGAYEIKEIEVKLTSLNSIDSKYELYYTLDKINNNLEVGYSISTEDPVLGSITAKSNKTITVVIRNNSDTDSVVTLKTIGGLKNNTLVLKEGYSLNQEIKVNFNDTILSHNQIIDAEPTLTTSSVEAGDAIGLYKSTATNFNGVEGTPTYYFRGNVENNYVEFAGFTWRIVRINEDGTIRLILSEAIETTDYQFNPLSNDKKYMYYSNSNVENGAMKKLNDWYNTNISSNSNYSNKVASGNYFCEQAKVMTDSIYSADSGVDMIIFSEYTPTFRCETDANGYGLVNTNIGLLTYDEVIYAGAYRTASNVDYYLYQDDVDLYYSFWIMSPAGRATNHRALSWHANTYIGIQYVDTIDEFIRVFRPVINLKADTVVAGLGTSTSPYKVINMSEGKLAIGDSVEAIDGSKWHVLEANGSDSRYVTLLSDYNLNSDGSYDSDCGRDIDGTYNCSPMAFDLDQTNTYDENDSNNIGYFIKNTYEPLVTMSLPGTTNVTLPTADQIANAEGKTYEDYLPLTKNWLVTTNYWLKSRFKSNDTIVLDVFGTGSRLNNCYANDGSYNGVRPVITTLKSNLLTE